MDRGVKAIISELARESLDEDRAAELLEQLVQLGEAATPAVRVVISKLGTSRLEAKLALAAMTPSVVAREMVADLGDPERRNEMVETLHSLAVHGTPKRIVEALRETAVPALLACFEDANVRRSAIPFALGMVGSHDERAFAKLVELVDDEESAVRWSTAHGLRHFGDRAIPYLEKLLDDFGEADLTAVRVLATIGTARARKALARAAKRRGRVGRKAKDELGSMRAMAAPRTVKTAKKAATRKAAPKQTKSRSKSATKTSAPKKPKGSR